MDWITVIIVLLIVGIVADGFRRVRKARRENLRISRNVQEFDNAKSFQVSTSEFPSGGARVVSRREPDEAVNLNQDVRRSYESSKITVGAPRRTPEQTSLNLEEVVPMLMDSLEEAHAELDLEEDKGPQIGNIQDLDLDDDEVTVEVEKPKQAVQAADAKTISKADARPDSRTETKAKTDSAKTAADSAKVQSEILVVSVMSKAGERFPGVDLLQALMNVHMKFGAMDIFHRYDDEDDSEDKIWFSLANMVKPGTFNLAEMKDFSTPGVTLFMQLPLHPDCESLQAFDIFANTARSLATELGGELKDENRSVMTSQTFEHYRQRVIEFERRQKLQHS